jgi:hypothetical protein
MGDRSNGSSVQLSATLARNASPAGSWPKNNGGAESSPKSSVVVVTKNMKTGLVTGLDRWTQQFESRIEISVRQTVVTIVSWSVDD